MKTTLLLLSLVAIALISGTEANTRYCSNCRGNHKRAGSFKGMWGMKDEMDDLYDDMDDEEASFFSIFHFPQLFYFLLRYFIL